ncbi:MAG: protein TolQ [Desulfobacterales bacterium]|nr:protein TolQ [Desulfobacterales bacterium]
MMMTLTFSHLSVFLPGVVSVDGAFGGDIVQMILHAGPVVKVVLLILFSFSVISWAIIFMKWRLFRRAKEENALFLELFWENTPFSKLQSECEELLFSPAANLFKVGYSEIVRMRKIQNPTVSRDANSVMPSLMDVVERSLRKTAIDQSNRLERALSFLATTGNTTPFIGLFGTVWGIMESFRGIGLKGSASLAVVAPGISEALIATAAGLAAAIPAVIAFNYFNNKVTVLRSEMDLFSADFLGLVERQIVKRSVSSKEG